MQDRRRFIRNLGLGAATVASLGAAASSARAASPGRPRRRPNVLVIVSDEHRTTACGCYGSPVRTVTGGSPTPHIDALAAEGARFDAMACASPLCAPSRAAYVTGTYPHTTTALHHKMLRREAGSTRFPGVRPDLPGMGQYFRDAGYRTAAIGKMHVHGELVDGWDLGFDVRDLRFYTRFPGRHYADLEGGDINARYRENGRYDDQRYRDIDPVRFAGAPPELRVRGNGVNQHFLETLVEREEDMFDSLVTRRSLDFIEDAARDDAPFFIHVGLEKPHRPWSVHRRFLDRFDPASMPLPDTVAEWEERGLFPFCQRWTHSSVKGDEARRSIAAYYGCVAQVDDCVGLLVDRVRALGLLDDTVIVYTSDHGESLYEHGLIEKHNMLDPAVLVPFVIRAPWALPAGACTDATTSLLDLLPTTCELAGVAPSPRFEGVSLLPAIHGQQDPDRLVFSEFYQDGSTTRPEEFLPVRMGMNRAHKYIYTHGAADQLYDRLAGGEATLDNLAFDPAHDALVARMRLCTLDHWELDEFPQLDATAEVTGDGVRLTWEPAGPGALHEVYRSVDGDPFRATRLAAGLAGDSFLDDAPPASGTCTYWVLGRDAVTEPFVDPSGKSRYGSTPILARHLARTLPITPRLVVRLDQPGARAFRYQPLLPCRLAGLDWIHVGPAPVPRDGVDVIEGPCVVLSPRALASGTARLAATIRTVSAGSRPGDVAMLVVGYRNAEHHLLVGLDGRGTFGIWRQAGEWKRDLVVARTIEGAVPGDWHRIEVRLDGNSLEATLGDHPPIRAELDGLLDNGRLGFEAPREVRSAEIRDIVAGWT